MMSRREKLLIRPWQQRKYENHRRKVVSVMPVIDNHPPPLRKHVNLKLKQLQKENERCEKIEKENLLLLKKLNCIMKTRNVDNYWNTPQPNFMNRVAIYDSYKKVEQNIYADDKAHQNDSEESNTKKVKCFACINKTGKNIEVPQGRIACIVKQNNTIRKRSKSVPLRKISTPLFAEPNMIRKQSSVTQNVDTVTRTKYAKSICSKKTTPFAEPNMNRKESSVTQRVDTGTRTKYAKSSCSKKNIDTEKHVKEIPPQSITLSRGNLEVALNFPSDTVVKFRSGFSENVLMNNLCRCKRFVISAQ